MSDVQSSLHQLGAMDQMARGESFVHRLDPRAKVLATLLFVIAAVSFGKYEISGLLPLCLFPVAIVSAAGIPAGFILRRMLFAAPFVVFVGLFNPLLDRQVVLHLGTVGVTGGWISFASILLRSALTIGAALLLIATTGMPGVCAGLERLGVPRIFAVQILLLYRYLFVLGEEAVRISRARSLRSFDGRGMGLKVAASMIGNLLLRTLDRAERIHVAMQSRGFDGEVRLLRRPRFAAADAAFVVGWGLFFAVTRLWNLPRILGALVTGGIG